MHDMKPLEEEWKKYKQKKMRPWYLGLFGILVLMIISILFYDKNMIRIPKFKTSFFHIDMPNTTKKKTKNSSLLTNGALVRLEMTDHQPLTDTTQDISVENNTLVDIPVLDFKGSSDNSAFLNKNRKKIHLDIIETSNVIAYRDVEKRFLMSHDIDDAFFLAKSYYKKGNYKKSEYWAYETNKLNADNAENLFIFIKSKVKLGKKNEAISILKNYNNQTNSDEGKTLLVQIENNQL